MALTLHLAKIIITNSGKPIINGGFLVEDSKIVHVDKKEDFGSIESTRIKIIDHGESLVCPGFINLHSHLLYSKADSTNRPTQDYGLFQWLGKLTDEISTWSTKDFIESINYGINEILSSGTTFVVENTPSELSIQELIKSPLKALIGLEVFGSDEEKADEIFNEALHLQSAIHNPKLDFTFSLHAPYDVSKLLWERLLCWSDENTKPLLTHLEESPDEKLWWQEKSGPAVDFWRKINKLEPKLKYWKKYKSGVDFLSKNKLLSKNIIATHLSQATKEDLKMVKENNIKLVHCPRSNFYLNCGTANLRLWDELGILWGVGTDSAASNNSLDLLDEVRFAIKEQRLTYDFSISAEEAFKLITLNPAKILSKDLELGCLRTSYCADFLIYDIKEKSACTYNDPYNLLIWDIDSKKDLKQVWVNGERVWIAEHLLNRI